MTSDDVAWLGKPAPGTVRLVEKQRAPAGRDVGGAGSAASGDRSSGGGGGSGSGSRSGATGGSGGGPRGGPRGGSGGGSGGDGTRAGSGPGGGPAKPEYTVIVAVREAGDGKQFLMVKHRERGWELPGGKLEPNEGPVHCALREFREETGHLLSQPHFVAKLRKENGICFIFTGGLGSAVENDAPDVIDAMEWFDRLPRDQKLAFPEDPYDEMGKLLGIRFG